MRKLYPLFLILNFQFLIFDSASAQKEANMWCFGSNIGLDFNSGSPVFFSGVAMNQWEGCSSIADANGDLLFYTDGQNVWNKNHQVMPNGTGLVGGQSATESALIVQQPNTPSVYYIFTTSDGVAGFNYSSVDMTLAGGLGDVVLKNVNLLPSCDERVTATRHQNGTDAWIVSTSNFSDLIYAFQFSSTGVNPVPVVSNNGLTHYAFTTNQIGSIKASQQGDHLGIAMNGDTGTFELYDFDVTTGMASLVMTTSSLDYKFAYGIEFSPDGTKMYGSEYGNGFNVYQFDLTLGSGAAIAASAFLVGTCSNYSAALQLAPDGKIYIAKWFDFSLAAINDPNQLGAACNFTDVAVSFPNQCNGGLPAFYPGLFQAAPAALFSAPNHICPGTCTSFNNLSHSATSYLWSFVGASPSTSTDVDPTNICYNTPGNYSVQLIASNSLGSDTLTLNNYITVYPYPAPQGIAQSGDTLFANAGAVSYQWYYNGNLIPGATDYFYVHTDGGDYNVVATDANGCEVEAVIFDVPTGLGFEVSDFGFGVYPNPVKTELKIKNEELKIGSAAIKIYNMIGEMVLAIQSESALSGSKSEMNVDVHSLNPGMYWIEISSSGKIFRTKFVKQ